MVPELNRLIEQMCKDRGIEKSVVVEALEVAMLTAARKNLGSRVDIEEKYNDEAGEIEVFQFKTVEERVTDPDMQISRDQARGEYDDEAEIGDSLGMKLDTNTFGRVAIQTAKQIIIQKVKDAERDNIYEEYKDRKGELVNGFVQRFEGGNIIVSIGHSEGVIDVVSVSREPGKRSKIAVRSKDKDIDPVGACVGMRGSRVQSVVQELRGEKIDIVPYTDDQ